MAGFALLMKGRADDRRLLEDAPRVVIQALRDGEGLDAAQLAQSLAPAANLLERSPLETNLAALLEFYRGAGTFGSLLQVPVSLEARLPRLRAALDAAPSGDLVAQNAKTALQPLVAQTELLAKKYSCVVANPPYMGGKGMNQQLKAFAAQQFPRAKADLFAMFIERGLNFAKADGFCALITMQSWMFLSSYESLREYLLEEKTLETMAHLGARAFAEIGGEVVQTTTFVLRNAHLAGYKPTFVRAVDGDEAEKSRVLREGENRFDNVEQKDFAQIPGSPIAYWFSKNAINSFLEFQSIQSYSEPQVGLQTSDNARFLRQWHEVEQKRTYFLARDNEEAKASRAKWFPLDKGGDFRRWYGNQSFVVDWENDGDAIKQSICERYPYLNGNPDYVVKDRGFFFKPGVTWTKISSGIFSVRTIYNGMIFSDAGMKIPCSVDLGLYEIASFLNSCVANYFLRGLSPTLNYEKGQIGALPFNLIKSDIAEEAISISRTDWDSFETSWDFARSPLLGGDSLSEAFARWETATLARRARLRELETENNRLFIEAYGLQDELAPDVPDEQITLARADREADLKRLVSYALGCVMGRYSLDDSGLVFAGAGGAGFDPNRYPTLPADADGILPVTDTHYFDDDAASRVADFLRAAYGAPHFAPNMAFLAQSLGARAGETPEETLRRYLVTDFYKDHLRTYRNRPIYWLFSSGKERAFGALVYLHRLHAGTLSRMRNDYVLPLQGRLQSRLDQLQSDQTELATPIARRNAEKEHQKRTKQLVELQVFDEKLRHLADTRIELDLDDGVKVNYVKFGDLLAETKAVTGL